MSHTAAAREGFLAGPDDTRLADIQAAFDDPSIDGVWALRGGYGTLRILDRLSLERQRRDPIPFIGFSDNTTIHVEHAAQGVVSFHGPHPGGDFPPETEEMLRRVLFSASPAGVLPRHTTEPEPRTLLGGTARGPLWGGNLTILASLCGSSSQLSAKGRILFIEDVGEPSYRVDRMLMQLERAHVLEGVAGIAMGRFTDVSEGEEKTLLTVLDDFAQRHGVPAVADLPFGHVQHNCTLPVGALAELDAAAGTLEVLEGAVGTIS